MNSSEVSRGKEERLCVVDLNFLYSVHRFLFLISFSMILDVCALLDGSYIREMGRTWLHPG